MRLEIDRAKKLAQKYGTPLYIYSEDEMRSNIGKYVEGFRSEKFQTDVLYASKAFSCLQMIELIKNCGMSLDVVSGGELHVALAAGFDPSKIYFHGNNKSQSELIFALSNDVGTIVVDNFEELVQLNELATMYERRTHILLRLNIGVDAHTHKYISTTLFESKFGMMPNCKEFNDCIKLVKQSQYVVFDGIHCHIGSQVFEINAYFLAIDKMLAVLKQFSKPMILNLGGGFGARYTESDKPLKIEDVTSQIVEYTEKALEKQNMSLKKMLVEPGRSIVAEAGLTLYTVGYVKQIPTKKFYFVDGGMTDNIRPALYQAKYDCDVIGKTKSSTDSKVSIAGKCCESGDILIEDILLPDAENGDLLAVYTTGAYGYSMASNYNKACTPAVVFVSGNKDKLVIKRQTYQDLMRNDMVGDYDEIR